MFQDYFDRSLEEMIMGFGEAESDYWLGLEFVHR